MEERRAAGAALLREVMAGNATMIERKAAEKQREAEEDRRILAYIRERDAKAQVRPACNIIHPLQAQDGLPSNPKSPGDPSFLFGRGWTSVCRCIVSLGCLSRALLRGPARGRLKALGRW